MTKTRTLAGAAAILLAISGAALAQSQGAGSSNSGPNARTTEPNAASPKNSGDKMGTKMAPSSTTTGQSGQSNPEANRVKTQNTDPQKK